MPGFMLNIGALNQCPHLGKVSTPPAQTRVLLNGQPVALATNVITVAGCPFQVPVPGGTKPQPCVTVKWLMVSGRVTVMGQPVLLQPAPGPGAAICQSAEQIPQGPPSLGALQSKVVAQ
jgi:hypothetical protein